MDDLGDTIDIVPLARRPKALDMTDNEAIIVNYDPDSDEFKRIAAKSLEKESHCMYGPSFLVFERSRGLFLEFFCGNKSSRSEAKKVYPYLPLTQADIDAKAANGDDVSEFAAARPAAADAEEPAGGEGHLLVARARGDEVQHGVHEFPEAGSGQQGDWDLLDCQGQRGRACRRSPTTTAPAKCHLLPAGLAPVLWPGAPAGFLREHTRCTAPAR